MQVSVEGMKESLSNVTGGLSTAFDTTLIALVMSMFVMFPATSMQKAEEDLLNWVDEYCNENLLRRLKDTNRNVTAGVSDAERKAILTAIDSAMAGHHAELKTWAKKLESVGGVITRDVEKGWKSIETDLQETHARNVQTLEKIVTSVQMQTETVGKLTERTDATVAIQKSTESLNEYFRDLQEGLESLNRVIGELNGKQVVVESKVYERPKRKRWGIF